MSINKSFSAETSERYSRALFEVSRDSNELSKVEEDIKNFQTLINLSKEIKNFLKDPTQNIKTQNETIILISNKMGFSKNLKNFLLLLIAKRTILFSQKIF